MTAALHPFDHAIALDAQAPDLFAGRTSEHYWNMISPYGGVTAAVLLQAILRHPARLGDPLAMTVNFAGAIRPGPFSVRAQPARTGRSTQHWQFELRQEGDTQAAALGTAVFALRRSTWSDTESRMPQVPEPAGLERYRPPRPAPFLERYDIRYADGNPFKGGDDSLTQNWVADVPPRPLDLPALAAYCDIFLPRVFVRRGAAMPIATVTMSINFHADAAALAQRPILGAFGEARANAFNGGFHDQEGRLWSECGMLLATTHQLVWFKE
jgi:acyl-CoA thioesterase